MTNIVTNRKELIYCPITSIVDPMSQCPYSNTDTRVIYPTKLHIQNTSETYKYVVTIDFEDKQEQPSVHIKGSVKVPRSGKSPITIDKSVRISKLPRPELSVGMVYKDMISTITKLLSQKEIQNPFQEFIRNITKDIIEGLCVKSIGDWGQEVTSISRFGAYAENRLDKLTLIMDGANVIPYDKFGQAKRLGVAGDRPSAFRMIYMCLFANPDSINRKAAVGYMTTYHKNDFIVYTPESNTIPSPPSNTQNSKTFPPLPPARDQDPGPKRARNKGGTRRKHKQKKSRKRKSNKYSRRGR
jgi:hypothetical protein